MRTWMYIILFFMMTPAKDWACDCNYNGSFKKMATYSKFVGVIKVIRYLTYQENKKEGYFKYIEKIPMSMEVEIIDIFKGTESRKTIIVWGDNGILCRPYVSSFQEGHYYLTALYAGNYSGGQKDEKDTDYSISGCGCYWLSVDFIKKTVMGDFDKNDRYAKQKMKLSALKSEFANPMLADH